MSAALKSDSLQVVDAQATPALAHLFTRISDVTTLPSAAQRIMELASNESASAADLLQVVEGDPVLAAKVLRRVNSAFYGLRNRVEDLRSAISLLGFREIRNLALTVYLARMFDDGSEYHRFSREGLWQHSVAVAQGARLISSTCRCGQPDQAYLAGLLHDLGLILLDQYMSKYLYQVVDQVSQGADTCSVERSLLPFDHTELGAYVALQWSFPLPVIAAARFHHEPLTAPVEHREIACLVSVANYLCHRANVTSLGTQNTFAPPSAVFAELQLEQAQLATVWDQLQEALATSPAM